MQVYCYYSVSIRSLYHLIFKILNHFICSSCGAIIDIVFLFRSLLVRTRYCNSHVYVYTLVSLFSAPLLPSQLSADSHGGQYAVPVAVEIHGPGHGVGADHRGLGSRSIW